MLIDFAVVVLKLLMFKVCGIIGFTKIEFSNISGTERVRQEDYSIQEILESEQHLCHSRWTELLVGLEQVPFLNCRIIFLLKEQPHEFWIDLRHAFKYLCH